MSDDDDDFDDDFESDFENDFELRLTGGNIIPSGITPEDVQPADYALPPGTPALQEEEGSGLYIEPTVTEFSPTPSRAMEQPRAWLLLAAGAAGASFLICGVMLGWLLRADTANQTPISLTASTDDLTIQSSLTDWAHQLADDDIARLWDNFFPYLTIVEQQRRVSPILWRGVQRLATVTFAERTAARWRRAQLLIQAIESREYPPQLKPLLINLKTVKSNGPGSK